MSIVNRCVFIAGVGRCHVLQGDEELHVAAMDARDLRDEFWLSNRALDILQNRSPGRVIWSVRFREHQPS